VISSQKAILEHATSFYKSLFGSSLTSSMHLSPCFWQGRGSLTEEDKTDLIKPFSEEEIKAAIFEMKSASAPGPNGFGVQFFKQFWALIKDDYVSMFKDLFLGQLDLQRLNYGVITLVPKI